MTRTARSCSVAFVLAAALVGCTPDLGGESGFASMATATGRQSAAPQSEPYMLTIREIAPIQVVVNLPDGWNHGGWVVIKNAAHLGLFPVDNVYADPCHWSGTLPEPPVGPTVEDLATALANQPTRQATATDITLDGYAGKLVRMSVPADVSFVGCDHGLFASWSEAGSDAPSRYAHGPGELEDVYIVDVGGTRVVIDAAHMPFTSAADIAELESIIGSIQFEP